MTCEPAPALEYIDSFRELIGHMQDAQTIVLVLGGEQLAKRVGEFVSIHKILNSNVRQLFTTGVHVLPSGLNEVDAGQAFPTGAQLGASATSSLSPVTHP